MPVDWSSALLFQHRHSLVEVQNVQF